MASRIRIVIPILLAATVLALGRRAYAEQFNRRNILPGGRAATMGGAYSAVADDASAGWYNPGGLGFVQGHDVSLSANAFTRTKRSIKEALGQHDVAESSTSLYPAFAGGTSTLGPFHVSYSYFTLDRENFDESFVYEVPATDTTAPFTYSRRQLTSGELMLAGGAVALPIGKNLSFGVGQFYYRRNRQASLVESTVFATGATFDANLRQSTINEGGVTTIGILLRGTQFSLGLTAKIQKPLADNTVIETNQITYTGSTPDRETTRDKPHNFDEVTPNEYGIGIAWQPAKWFLMSADGLYNPPTQSPHSSLDGVNTRPTTNWSAGVEIVMGMIGVRGGSFSNNSLVDSPDVSKTNQPAHINYQGYSGGLTFRSKSSETTLGVIYQSGEGSDQTVSGSNKVYEVQAESTSYLLTSRYSL